MIVVISGLVLCVGAASAIIFAATHKHVEENGQMVWKTTEEYEADQDRRKAEAEGHHSSGAPNAGGSEVGPGSNTASTETPRDHTPANTPAHQPPPANAPSNVASGDNAASESTTGEMTDALAKALPSQPIALSPADGKKIQVSQIVVTPDENVPESGAQEGWMAIKLLNPSTDKTIQGITMTVQVMNGSTPVGATEQFAVQWIPPQTVRRCSVKYSINSGQLGKSLRATIASMEYAPAGTVSWIGNTESVDEHSEDTVKVTGHLENSTDWDVHDVTVYGTLFTKNGECVSTCNAGQLAEGKTTIFKGGKLRYSIAFRKADVQSGLDAEIVVVGNK